VDAFYEGENFLVIHPDICIDCGLCVPECPVEAIFQDTDLPQEQQHYLKINADLAEVWPNITELKQPPDDAEKWIDVADKLPLLEQYTT
jgi:ferredoxin